MLHTLCSQRTRCAATGPLSLATPEGSQHLKLHLACGSAARAAADNCSNHFQASQSPAIRAFGLPGACPGSRSEQHVSIATCMWYQMQSLSRQAPGVHRDKQRCKIGMALACRTAARSAKGHSSVELAEHAPLRRRVCCMREQSRV